MPVYLDNNATVRLDSRVLEAMLPYFQDRYGNASSIHRYGRLARAAIEGAREQVAALVGAHSSQIIFTGGGTEANNLALHGVIAGKKPGYLALSAIEHSSIREPMYAMCRQGWQIEEVAVDEQGRVCLESLQQVLQPRPDLLSVMLANNETGVIQDIAAIAAAANVFAVPLHTDASQAAGKIPVDFSSLGAEMMTLSAHKLGGPLGAGALIADKKHALQPLIMGGGHERGLRAGTENVAVLVGFGVAAELAQQELVSRAAHMLQLREKLEQALSGLSGIEIFSSGVVRLPNTVQFGIRGCHGETLLMQLDRKGIAVSSGSACRSGMHEPSHVLSAMGVEKELALTAIRVSIGYNSNEQDITDFINALVSVVAMFSRPSGQDFARSAGMV